MKKKICNMFTKFFIAVLIVSMAIPFSGEVSAAASSEISRLSGDEYLGKEIALITENGNAVVIDGDTVKATGEVKVTEGGVKVSDNSNFTITKHSTEAFYAVNNTKINRFLQLTGFGWDSNLTVTAGNGQWNADRLNEPAWEGLVIEEVGDSQYIITTTERFADGDNKVKAYVKIKSNSALGITQDESEATIFYFSLVKGTIEDNSESDDNNKPDNGESDDNDKPDNGESDNNDNSGEDVTDNKESGIGTYLEKKIVFITEDDKVISVSEENEVVKVDGSVEYVGDSVKASASSVFSVNGDTEKGIFAINNYDIKDGRHLLMVNDRVFWRKGNFDSVPGEGAWEGFVFEDAGENTYYLTTTNRISPSVYATINENEELKCTTDKGKATKFKLMPVKEVVKDEENSSNTNTPEKPVVSDSDFTIEHVATKKLVKTYNEEGVALTVDGKEGEEGTVFSKAVFGINNNNSMEDSNLQVVSFVSKDYNKGIVSVAWNDGPVATVVKVHGSTSGTGWESVQLVANGDGTVSFKDSYYDQYITVEDVDGKPVLSCMSDITKKTLTDNEKFIIRTKTAPGKLNSLAITNSTRTQTTLELTWEKPNSIYTNLQLLQKGPKDEEYKKIADLADETSYKVTGLASGTEYSFKLLVINGMGNSEDTTCSSESNVVTATTRAGLKPSIPTNVKLKEKEGNTVLISWDKADNATHYQVMRAESMFGTYEVLDTVKETSAEIAYEGSKYTNYYRIVALNNGENGDEDFSGAEKSEESKFVSVETNMFGDHTLIFAPTDDVKKIDETLKQIFEDANDRSKDAQFRGEHWQIYFKPGDYTETSCINLGFYTSINGLGKTPYAVKLNNIAIPDYMSGNNATCNFWRSVENISIINTGNEQGKAQYGSWRGDWFNWAVAQAAPLRRVYSERPVAYDWNYGWASGGYVADSYFVGKDGEGNSAGTWSGQQFYTRNAKISGNVFGTTLNNFFQGVEAPNLPNEQEVENNAATALLSGKGYSNWQTPTAGLDQQVFTNIEKTDKIAEKPFLYIDDNGEYQVFVPAVRKNTKGISWSKDDMGAGKSIPLDTFYIAEPTDTAAMINEQLAKGKNIYFTPGIYYAEEVIKVTNPDTIILGSGLTTIIPTNDDAAMRVADVDGVRLAGLIFDAGKHSKYLLVVGEQGAKKGHASNPTILQDLFFRVGGTTDELTKSDNALEINSNDVISDHFWIWRADHGAGVEWYGNESDHGLIVNGDNVICYALFNEHFQKYGTLWNGENGTTYFYQNETCYDPISQEAWMSHDGTVKGYASYKVSDNVKKHYAVGLGIYNVFIYTGPTYDAEEVQIQLDNAIEVPDTKDVLVENVCLQTFADEKKSLQKINSIVNGLGDCVSSGTDSVTGEKGTGWDRTFLAFYCDGEAGGSYRIMSKTYTKLKETHTSISKELDRVSDEALKEELKEALDNAKSALNNYEFLVTWPIQKETKQKVTNMENALADLKETAVKAGVLTGEEADAVKQEKETAKKALAEELESAKKLKKADYTANCWKTFEDAIKAATKVGENEDATLAEINAAMQLIEEARAGLIKSSTTSGGTTSGGTTSGGTTSGETTSGGTTSGGTTSGGTASGETASGETTNHTTVNNIPIDDTITPSAAMPPAEVTEDVTPSAVITKPMETYSDEENVTGETIIQGENKEETNVSQEAESEETNIQEEAETTVEPATSEDTIIDNDKVANAPAIPEETDALSEETGSNVWWIIVIGVMVVVIGFAVVFAMKNKKMNEQ